MKKAAITAANQTRRKGNTFSLKKGGFYGKN